MVLRECPHCKQEYLVDEQKIRYGRRLYCTRKCAFAAKQDPTKFVEGLCIVCGTPVHRYVCQTKDSKAPGLLCSSACHYKARSMGLSKRVVTKPYNWTEEGKQKTQAAMRAGFAKYFSEGKCKQTEETKRKLSVAQTLAMMSGKISRISQLERDVGTVLTQLGYVAQPQYGVRDALGRFVACCDYYLPDKNVAVEVNGTYWHADPRVYPLGPTTPSQRRTAERYAKKMSLLKERGLIVVEIWESDFKTNPVNAIEEALRAGGVLG